MVYDTKAFLRYNVKGRKQMELRARQHCGPGSREAGKPTEAGFMVKMAMLGTAGRMDCLISSVETTGFSHGINQ